MIAQTSRKQNGTEARVAERINRFAGEDLDIHEVWWPSGNARRDLKILDDLARWVAAYRALGSRKAMEAKGFDFPPVEPGIEPDTDWLRFEAWVNGEPVSWNLQEEAGQTLLSETLADDAVARNWDYLTGLLAERNVVVDCPEETPLRIRHDELIRYLREASFDITSPETRTHILGCEGGCESCVFADWCECAEAFALEDAG